MRKIARLAVLGTCALFLSAPAMAADSPQERAIEARQADMELRAFNFGPIVGMLKRELPYDADQAQMFADNLKLLAQLDISSSWMPGTSKTEFPDSTYAKPALWDADSKAMDHEKDFVNAANELASVASDGLKALAPKVKQLGKTCKSCHDDYRAKK